MIRELAPNEFTQERFLPLLRAVDGCVYQEKEHNPEFFFPKWRELMGYGVARAWEGTGCMIGAFITPDIFRASPVAMVVFWGATPEGKKTRDPLRLLAAVEKAARKSGCGRVSSAAHADMNHGPMCELYRRRGYRLQETVFRLDL